MEKLQELKELAYQIATEKSNIGYSDQYRWSVDARIDAMKAYARLVMAEKTTTQN